MNFALIGDRLQQADRADFAINSHGNVRPQPAFRHQLFADAGTAPLQIVDHLADGRPFHFHA